MILEEGLIVYKNIEYNINNENEMLQHSRSRSQSRPCLQVKCLAGEELVVEPEDNITLLYDDAYGQASSVGLTVLEVGRIYSMHICTGYLLVAAQHSTACAHVALEIDFPHLPPSLPSLTSRSLLSFSAEGTGPPYHRVRNEHLVLLLLHPLTN